MIQVQGQSRYLAIEVTCTACEWCKYNCPIDNCITFDTLIADINHDLCIECGRCIYVCPVDAIVPLREAQYLKGGKSE